jgi:hypothetical protein
MLCQLIFVKSALSAVNFVELSLSQAEISNRLVVIVFSNTTTIKITITTI